MQPSEIRHKVRADHEAIRDTLLRLEELARQVLQGDRQLVGTLRDQAAALLAELLEHIRWEDENLRPTLLEADGGARAEKLDHDHQEQRELLGYALDRLEDQSRPPLVIARNLVDLVQLLRDDMDDEEKNLLGDLGA